MAKMTSNERNGAKLAMVLVVIILSSCGIIPAPEPSPTPPTSPVPETETPTTTETPEPSTPTEVTATETPWPPSPTEATGTETPWPLTPTEVTATPSPSTTPSPIPNTQDPPPSFGYPGRMHSHTDGWAFVLEQTEIDVKRLFHTSDGGRTWFDVLPEEDQPSDRRIFFEVDGSSIWLISSTYVIGGTGLHEPTQVTLQFTSDGGASWHTSNIQIDPGAYVVSAGFVGSLKGWLLAIPFNHPDDPATVIYHTDDGGNSWSEILRAPQSFSSEAGPGELPPQCTPSGIRFADALNGWIIGNCDAIPLMLYQSIDGGLTWEAKYPPIPPGESTDFFEANATYPDLPIFVSANDGYFFLLWWKRLNPRFFLYITHNGGETWEYAELPAATYRNRFDAVDGDNAWASDGDRLFFSNDGWRTWHFASDSPAEFINEIEFVDNRVGWLVTSGDVPPPVFFTADAGSSWIRIYPQVVID
jgi:photosystem II stability/assembly factor-like uncharacterized protein